MGRVINFMNCQYWEKKWKAIAVCHFQTQIFSYSMGTYVTAHSPTLPSLYLRHSSFSTPSTALSTSQLILQPFCCFTYVSSFANPTFASLMSQDLHWRHLACRPWAIAWYAIHLNFHFPSAFLSNTIRADLEDLWWSADHSLRNTALGCCYNSKNYLQFVIE